MIATGEDEPQVSIHITGTKSRSLKRSSSKQKNKGSVPKKPRVTALSNNDSTKDVREKAKEPTVASDRAPDVSFRHLFNFAKNPQEDGQLQKRMPAPAKTPSFSFLNKDNEAGQKEEVNADVALRYRDLETDITNPDTREDYPMTDQCVDRSTAQRFSGSYRRGMASHRKSNGGNEDSTGPGKFLYQKSNGEHGRQVETNRVPTSDILMIPEDIDSRPDEILQIATMFCRKKSVEQLEDEWCSPGGVRETLRRDFKQKRQNVARGRKLGSSAKR